MKPRATNCTPRPCGSARRFGYRSAGTVEFVYDAAQAKFYFLEVNTRLQVEHGVTEEVGGIDLVEWMIRTAAGEPPDLREHRHVPRGHAIQARVYAEDPARGFRPSSGLLTQVKLPVAKSVRVDGWVDAGTEVTGYYDPMLAKIIARGATRELAIANLAAALAAVRASTASRPTSPTWCRYSNIRCSPPASRPRRCWQGHAPPTSSIEVLAAGTLTTVQDWPGRLGLWDVGVPPSGPMDALALRLANRMVGNEEGAAALEMTVTGATLRFDADAVIALAGATMEATLDGVAVPFWQPLAGAARQRARARTDRRRRPARLSRGARQLRHSRISRQPRHVHARTVRRPRRPRAARR